MARACVAEVAVIGSVERLWPGSTIVCIGGGPSLNQADVDRCKGAHVIAVNDAYRMAPWADVLYACDARWWNWHAKALSGFEGLRFGLHVPNATVLNGCQVTMLRNAGPRGLSNSPDAVCHGSNSGYQAVNVAVHLGASRIVLLGYDMQPSKDGRVHWFGQHAIPQATSRPPFEAFKAAFESLRKPLKDLGIEVINATRETALTTFPRVTIDEALA